MEAQWYLCELQGHSSMLDCNLSPPERRCPFPRSCPVLYENLLVTDPQSKFRFCFLKNLFASSAQF